MEIKNHPVPFSVLLADDDIDDCAFFKEALEEFPLTTSFIAVHDGEELMNLLNNSFAALPHVIFLDLNMPRKNGFECLSAIKQHKQLNHLPVVMYSTSQEQDTVNLLFKNGAQHFIRKPAEFSKFTNIIQQALTLIANDNTKQPRIENFILTA